MICPLQPSLSFDSFSSISFRVLHADPAAPFRPMKKMQRFVRLHISCETAAQLLNGDKSERERRESRRARSERSVCPLIRSTPLLSFPNYHRLPAPIEQGASPLCGWFIVFMSLR